MFRASSSRNRIRPGNELVLVAMNDLQESDLIRGSVEPNDQAIFRTQVEGPSTRTIVPKRMSPKPADAS